VRSCRRLVHRLRKRVGIATFKLLSASRSYSFESIKLAVAPKPALLTSALMLLSSIRCFSTARTSAVVKVRSALIVVILRQT
jgi:hypothetical protein